MEIVRADKIAIDSLLETLTVRQKIGQLIMPWLRGNYAAFESEEFDTLAVWIDSLEVGGIVISVGPPLEIAAKLNALQRRSRLPLLVAADLEWGSGMRLTGGTAFPMPMAIGATGRAEDAYEMGRITALEARAVGIHWTFSPVADVNNNPANPIINTRSFGEDPVAISRHVAAYVRGASENGLFTTAKHFPGHGDTDADSHIALPVVRGCWDRLDSLELVPFRAAVRAGVTAVMTAHVALSCFDGNGQLPASLSVQVTSDLLRDSLGFTGMVVTDALRMGAIVKQYGPGESVVKAFLAGSDMLLIPSDLRAAIDAMAAAVAEARIPTARLDQSVRRVLELKARAGLLHRRAVPLDRVQEVVGRRDFRTVAEDIASRSLTLVQRGPLDAFRRRRGSLAVITYAAESNLSIGGSLVRELRRAGDTAQVFRLFPASGTLSYDSARTLIEHHDRVLFAVSVRVISGRGHIAMPDSLAILVVETAGNRPTVLASFGSPYLLSQIPQYDGGYLVAWSDVAATERAVALALAGGAEISGRLPISLSAMIVRGFGIDVRTEPMVVDTVPTFESLHRFLEEKVEEGAFPGAVLLVGLRGSVRYGTAVGRYGENDPKPVSDTTVYDLASLTKVVGLTTACMLLLADGRLDLDTPVSRYVPAFAQQGKEAVTVRHLLTHTSGLPAWRPLYQEAKTRDAAIDTVLATVLKTPPGEAYVYSDIGAIALAQVVEAVAGISLDAFLEQRLFRPLGMTRTRFRPPSSWQSFIAPTERDPWRGRTLRGEVHDENAARLEGISGHAGLFSNAPDLMTFTFWLLDAYHGRLGPEAAVALPAELVRGFTSKQNGPAGSTRALGWDTPYGTGTGSAGSLLSPASFGHTGFTGTSIWTDPERELVIVLLTNRVHPTRENRAILRIRGELADRVVRAVRAGTLPPDAN